MPLLFPCHLHRRRLVLGNKDRKQREKGKLHDPSILQMKRAEVDWESPHLDAYPVKTVAFFAAVMWHVAPHLAADINYSVRVRFLAPSGVDKGAEYV